MPTIPSLERRTVNPQVRMATVNPRGMASLGNVVGQGINEVQGAFKEAKDKSNRYELADAASKFSIMKNQQDNAFDESDLEYGTYVERYSKNVGEGLSEIASGISDPELRNLFMLENQPRVTAGAERMGNRAFLVETDVQRGNVNSRLNGLREVMMGDDDAERVQAIRDAKDLLDSAKAKGYYSSEEMVNLQKAYTVDAAFGYVDTLPVNQQREALNSPFVTKNVPPDDLAKKLRALEGPEVLEQAQIIADGLSGKPEDEQYAEIKKHSGDLREEIKRQVDYDNNNIKKIKLNTDQTLHQDWYMKVIRGEEGFSLEDLKNAGNKDFSKLEVSFQKDLMNAAQGRVKGSLRTASDATTIDELHRLNSEASEGRGSYDDLRTAYKLAVKEGKLTPTHMDKWSQISNEGIVEPELESTFTLIQMVDQRLASQGITDTEDRLVVRDRLDKYIKTESTRLEKQLDPKVIDQRLNELIKEVMIPRTGLASYLLSGKKKRLYETTPDDITELGVKFLEDPQDMSPENFTIASREMLLENRNDPELRFGSIGSALTRIGEMEPKDQEDLLQYIRENESETFDRVFNHIQNSGRTMTSELFMESLSEVFNGAE
jgi:hypothetical protein